MFSDDPKKAAKELSHELSEMVEQTIKSGYGSELIKDIENVSKEE